MRNWWHRLWCGDCRDLRPVEIVALPNESPLYAPTLYFLKSGFLFLQCPAAKTRAQASLASVVASICPHLTC